MEFLPMGSIVKLNSDLDILMIVGRKDVSETKIYDYSAVLYPFGYIREEGKVFFSHNQIEQILFKGYQDEEELLYEKFLMEQSLT